MTRLFTLLVALFLAMPASAQPVIDQAGADALKPRIDQALNYFAQTMQKSNITLQRSGDLMVEPAGSYYAVTSPSITLKMPDGVTRTVGMIAINAIPTADPDVFKVAVALPTPMLDTSASGEQVGSLSFGSQTMNGLWNMTAAAFIEMNGQYKNIHLTNKTQQLDIAIPALTLTSKLTPNGKFWQGPSEAIFTDYTHKDAKGSYQIGTLRVKTDVRELDFNSTPSSKPVSGLSAMQTILADYLTRYANAADITVAADNIAFQGARTGTIKTASLQSNLANLKSAAADATWNVGLDGIAMTGASAQRFTPSRVAFKGAGKKLPMDDLLRIAESGSIKDVLAKAGSDITVENLMLDAPAYGVDAKGNVVASNTSPLGGVGTMSMKVRGIQELNGWLATPDAPKTLGLQSIPPQVTAILAIVQLTGKDGTDASGRPTKDFDLQVTPGGKISVNGADMSALGNLGGQMGGQMGSVLNALGKQKQ